MTININNQSLKKDIELNIQYVDGTEDFLFITEGQTSMFNYCVTDSSQKWASINIDNYVKFIKIDMIKSYSYRKVEEENNEGKCEEEIKKD